MTPPVATDPSLRVPGSHLAVVAGFVIVSYFAIGAAQYALVPQNADIIYSPTAMLLTIALYGTIGAAVWWAARQTADAGRALGLVAPPSWPRAIGLALLTVVAALAVSALLEPILHAAREQGLAPDTSRPQGLSPIIGAVLACVALALVGPFVEELLFRGLLTAAFRQRFGPIRTALLTAALFALAHVLPRVIPPIFILGLALALVYERVGSTIPGILVHCLYNGIAVAAALTHH
ncbi:MAG TPA: type II CAAX endopeptidase family protein [Gaiellales bacterium]|jgi:membrane protease YdiL (CAAX protease family)|nr:type II CAAX endopeptidase family protein [Gaiellales bacterium]